MVETTETVENLGSYFEKRRFGHLRQKKYVGEVETVEFQGEEVLYREIDDRDQTKARDLNYLVGYGFAEGDPYKVGPLTDAWDFRTIPEEDREKVEEMLEDIEEKEVVWEDG